VVRDLFLSFLRQHDDHAWHRAIDRIAASIHPVDRNATRIWFHLFPLALQEAMARPEAADLARRMTLAGRWRLEEQIETSHHFLFGHAYWPQARAAVLAYAAGAPGSLDLGAQIHEVARQTAQTAGVAPALTLGISAIALRTLQQVGPDALASAPAAATLIAPPKASADAVVAVRARERRSLLAFFGGDRRVEVVFDERDPDASFPLIRSQHLTTAAALDTRDHRGRDARCSEGPIPVHCRSCSCGTCWIGVLAGEQSLSPMDGRERAKLRECGVVVEGSHPPIRLACMSQAFARTTIVIPPWNGLVGRVVT
jgi:ferredoxin